jgi:hypothetical protein
MCITIGWVLFTYSQIGKKLNAMDSHQKRKCTDVTKEISIHKCGSSI